MFHISKGGGVKRAKKVSTLTSFQLRALISEISKYQINISKQRFFLTKKWLAAYMKLLMKNIQIKQCLLNIV